MTNAGLQHVIDRLLGCKTKGQALGVLDQCGDSYRAIAQRLLERFVFERTTNQNALLHKWYGQIASHLGDVNATDVKGMCHHEFALTIRLRDPQFAWVWGRLAKCLSYEKQCALLASGNVGISSKMTTKEFKEYMDAIEQKYRPQGVQLVSREGDK